MDQSHPIYFNGHLVEAEALCPGGEYHHDDAAKSNYILIQATHLLKEDERDELEALHVEVMAMIGQHTYLCRYKPADLEAIRSKPYVIYATTVHQHLCTAKALQQTLRTAGKDELFDVLIVLHHKCRSSIDNVANRMVQELHIPRDRIWPTPSRIEAKLKAEEIRATAHLDEVMAVDEVEEEGAFNNLATETVHLPYIDPTLPPFGDYDGTGQIIGVSDSGFGNWPNPHPMFGNRVVNVVNIATGAQKGPIDISGHGTHVAGTVLGQYTAIFPPAPFNEPNFKLDGSIDGAAPQASLYFQSIFGDPIRTEDITEKNLASQARKTWPNVTRAEVVEMWQRKRTPIGPSYVSLHGVPPNQFEYYNIGGGSAIPTGYGGFQQLCRDAYAAGVRIHNNSWGTGLVPMKETGTYNPNSKDADDFVFENPDFLHVRAAGNDGDKPFRNQNGMNNNAQIQTYAITKNSIVVGACYSNGRFVNDWGTPRPFTEFPANPSAPTAVVPRRTVDPIHVGQFSSRGPGRDTVGIIKPDLVAPGIVTYSAHSPAALKASNGADPGLHFRTGTSMAAPLVAGCAALIRQGLMEQTGLQAIPASMIKAILINGAVDLATKGGRLTRGMPIKWETDPKCININDPTTGADIDLPTKDSGNGAPTTVLDPAPSFVQGYGRVDMKASLDHLTYPLRHGYSPIDNTYIGLKLEAKPEIYAVQILNEAGCNNAEISVTAAYTDSASASATGRISLTVTFPSQAGKDTSTDPTFPRNPNPRNHMQLDNNVQRIRIDGLNLNQQAQIIVTLRNRADRNVPLKVSTVWSIRYY